MAQPPPPPTPPRMQVLPKWHDNTLLNLIPLTTFTAADAREMLAVGGWHRDLTNSHTFQIAPDWSDPQWDGSYQRRVEGTKYLEKEVRPGNRSTRKRPFIRMDDAQLNPTEYAKRFGVAARGNKPQRDTWGHSGLTPTDPAFQTTPQAADDDNYDQSLQNTVFGYTTSELAEQGAFNPRLNISPPDIDEPIHELFARRRWDQAVPGHPSMGPVAFDVRYGSELKNTNGAAGTPGNYDAINNQEVWDALEPGLRLASKVISSGHPFWLAMTNIYHLRPVAIARDGRTPAQRKNQGGRPYVSVWLDENDPRAPAPYPEMQNLKSLGFDSTRARRACMEILRDKLAFKICAVAGSWAATAIWGDAGILQIYVDAALIWPLLTQHISDAERATYNFRIAASLLHELGHACKDALHFMTIPPILLQANSMPAFGGSPISQEVQRSLMILGREIWGTFPRPGSSGIQQVLRIALDQDLFFEDEVQGEDGINFEKQLWGGRVSFMPHADIPIFSSMPINSLEQYPRAHRQPLEQGRTNLDIEDTAYKRWLTDARAPSWDETTAIPIEWYGRYFEKAWWQSEFQKYQVSIQVGLVDSTPCSADTVYIHGSCTSTWTSD